MDLLMRETGKSRHVIKKVISGQRVDPKLRDKIDKIISEELSKQQELLAKLPHEV